MQINSLDLRYFSSVCVLTDQVETNVEAQSVTDSLPDRLIHPEEYEPMLPHCREKHNR